MTSLIFDVENIKCGGCENSIRKGLSSIAGVSEVQIDREQQRITLLANQAERSAIADKLRSVSNLISPAPRPDKPLAFRC